MGKKADIPYTQESINLLAVIIDIAEGLLDPANEYIAVHVTPEKPSEKTATEIMLFVEELEQENLITLPENQGPFTPLSYTFHKTDVYKNAVAIPTYYQLKVLDIWELKNKLQHLQEKNENRFIRYDKDAGNLVLEDASIPLKPNTRMSDLLEVLIKHRGRKLANDEMLTEWGYQEDELTKHNMEKVFHSARNLNGKIGQYSTAKDFISYTKHEVGINQKYL